MTKFTKSHVDALRQRDADAKPSRRVALDDSPSPYGPLDLIAARTRVWDGIDVHPIIELRDGTTGYGSDPARPDDCFRPAIATLTQIPIEEVPDPRLDQRLVVGEDPDVVNREAWEELIRWAAGRGLRINLHDDVPLKRNRWIGMVETGAPCEFATHCLVLAHGELLFDPGISSRPPPGYRQATYTPDDVSLGVTFDLRKD
jgi:hypothetical protein